MSWANIRPDTIITSFPHTWAHLDSHADPLDVHTAIVNFLENKPKRNRINNVMKLAFLIIDRCAGNVMDQNLLDQSDLQFIQFFDRSIDILVRYLDFFDLRVLTVTC